MKHYYERQQFTSKQEGVALFVSLIMLLILTIIGLSAAQRSNLQEKMAANTHLQNLAFNSAESAIGGFLAEANVPGKDAPPHILFNLRFTNKLDNQCFDQNGVRNDCDTAVKLDGDKAGMITSQMTVEIIDPCNTRLCPGFSMGASGGGTVGCRIYQVDGTGEAAAVVANHRLLAYEVTACY